MTQHAPVFIVLLPMTASLLCMLFSRISRNLGSYVVMASIVAAFASAVTVLQQVIAQGGKAIHYYMGGWMPPIGIEFVLDPLNSMLAVLVTFVAMVVSFYGLPFVKDDFLVLADDKLIVIGRLKPVGT